MNRDPVTALQSALLMLAGFCFGIYAALSRSVLMFDFIGYFGFSNIFAFLVIVAVSLNIVKAILPTIPTEYSAMFGHAVAICNMFLKFFSGVIVGFVGFIVYAFMYMW